MRTLSALHQICAEVLCHSYLNAFESFCLALTLKLEAETVINTFNIKGLKLVFPYK